MGKQQDPYEPHERIEILQDELTEARERIAELEAEEQPDDDDMDPGAAISGDPPPGYVDVTAEWAQRVRDGNDSADTVRDDLAKIGIDYDEVAAEGRTLVARLSREHSLTPEGAQNVLDGISGSIEDMSDAEVAEEFRLEGRDLKAEAADLQKDLLGMVGEYVVCSACGGSGVVGGGENASWGNPYGDHPQRCPKGCPVPEEPAP